MNHVREELTVCDKGLGTHNYLQQVAVKYEYPVWFTQGVFDPQNSVFVDSVTRIESGKRHQIAVIIDEGVFANWPDLPSMIESYFRSHSESLELVAVPLIVPGGEAAKNDERLVNQLQKNLLDLAMDRHAIITAIGGGAMLDLVGFVAATTHRGIRLIRIPTTVLSQADSGISVKNGINAFGIKNFVGTFTPPFSVINDFDFFSTLSDQDKVAGMAEAVKVALIRDQQFFEWLEKNSSRLRCFEPNTIGYMIRRCAELHMEQIVHGGDPFETGNARPLDFGHWAAHKLESLSQHHLRHGEAVAIGIALDTRYSVQTALLPGSEDQRVCTLLERLGFTLWSDYLESVDNHGSIIIFQGLKEFQEHLGGDLSITMLNEVGFGIEIGEIDEREMLRAFAWLKARNTTA